MLKGERIAVQRCQATLLQIIQAPRYRDISALLSLVSRTTCHFASNTKTAVERSCYTNNKQGDAAAKEFLANASPGDAAVHRTQLVETNNEAQKMVM